MTVLLERRRGRHQGDVIYEERVLKQSQKRHTPVIRITHWINVLCMTILLMSGLQIFNARPMLYWGKQSNFNAPILSMQADPNDDSRGQTTIGSRSFTTTGWLGVSQGEDDKPTERGFPAWLTIPSAQDLANGRRWHFFFAWLFVINGSVYAIYSLVSRHLWRDLLPRNREWRTIPQSLWQHARLHFSKGAEARHYNIIQKITYVIVLLGLMPIMILAGLAMSPGIDSAFPILLELFGGRQSARTIHFVIAWLLVLFVVIHVVMVFASGLFNNMRSMITGRYLLDEKRVDDVQAH